MPALNAIGFLLLACLLWGCGGGAGGPAPERRAESGQLFAGPATASGRGEGGEQVGRGWSITIVVVRGGQEMAASALERVQTAAGFRQAYIEQKGDAFVVAYGNYSSATEPQAQTDLKRIQAFEFDGGRPFSGAVLMPPPNSLIRGGMPEFNLMVIRDDPLSKAKYTLQIGVYGRLDNQPPSASDLAEFRKAAEKAAALLRRDGEEAYYYHGPTKSMVMIGAFDESDYDDRHPGLNNSPRLRAAMEKYPHNLVNGAGYKQKFGGATEATLQKSQIVNIPK